MVREVLCDCGVSRLWLERYSARVDYTGDASLQKSEVRSRRAPPRDEVKGFRIACGEFIGVSMWAGKSWKIQEWLWCHKEFPVPKVCLPRAANIFSAQGTPCGTKAIPGFSNSSLPTYSRRYTRHTRF